MLCESGPFLQIKRCLQNRTTFLPLALGCSTDCSDIEEHTLRTTLSGAFQGNEAIAPVPFNPVPVRVGNNAPAPNIIRHSKRYFEGFGDKSVSESPSRKVPVYCKPGEQNQRQI